MSLIKKVNLPPLYQLILKGLFPTDSKTVLDLGCGKGIAGELLNSNHSYDFIGVDIFSPYVRICQKSGYYKKVIRKDLTKVNLKRNSYDAILLLQVLEHLTKEEALELLDNVVKASRKCVIVSLPNGDCSQEEYEENKHHEHKSKWNPKDLQKLGFEVHGQSFKPIFGNKSYGSGRRASLWQKVVVPLSSILLFPFIYFLPSWGAQLIAAKYKK